MKKVAKALARRCYHAAAAAAHEDGAECTEFVSWLRKRGALGENTAVSIGKSQFGRALVASRDISAGSRFLEISRDVIITPDKLPREIGDAVTTTNPKTRLSLFLLAEKHKGQESAWAPYIQCLPRFGEIESTIFWKDEELAWLEHSPAYRETNECLKIIATEYLALQDVLHSFPRVFGAVSLSDFMHAYSTVTSRSWGSRDEISIMSMIPYADFLNHHPSCGTRLSYDANNNYAVAVADRDYAAGDEVFLNYCCSPNAILAVDYGFALPINPYEQVVIWLELPTTDPLREMKLDILLRHNMLDEEAANSGRKSFVFWGGRLAEEKTYHTLASLYAFARVICAGSCEDLEEMLDESLLRDDFYALQPRMDNSKEQEVVAFLSGHIRSQIDQLDKALQAVKGGEPLPTNTERRPALLAPAESTRRQIAANVLKGELGVLESLCPLIHRGLKLIVNRQSW